MSDLARAGLGSELTRVIAELESQKSVERVLPLGRVAYRAAHPRHGAAHE